MIVTFCQRVNKINSFIAFNALALERCSDRVCYSLTGHFAKQTFVRNAGLKTTCKIVRSTTYRVTAVFTRFNNFGLLCFVNYSWLL